MKKRGRGQGEGTIFEERPGRWVAQITTGYVITDGKRRRLRKKFVGATRKEVHGRLTESLNSQQHGRNISPRMQKLGNFLDVWLESMKEKVKPKTLRTYSDIVRLHIKPALGDLKVNRLTPEVVETLLTDKLGSAQCPYCKESFKAVRMPVHITTKHPDAKPRGYRALGTRTVSHIRATLRGAIAKAVKNDEHGLNRNVAALAEPPRLIEKKMRFLTGDEARKYLGAAVGIRLESLFTVTVALGLRQGEILGLKWTDIDFESGMLSVQRSLQRVEGKLVFVDTKTNGSNRPLILPAVAVSTLRRHQCRQIEERNEAGDQWRESGLVFTSSIGTPLDARAVIRVHHAILKAAGIPRLRFHDLRHSAATLLLAQGVSPKYISEMLGHSRVAFTMQTYAHVIKEVQQQVADKMDAILNPVQKVAPQVAPSEVSAPVN
jgi:integrase